MVATPEYVGSPYDCESDTEIPLLESVDLSVTLRVVPHVVPLTSFTIYGRLNEEPGDTESEEFESTTCDVPMPCAALMENVEMANSIAKSKPMPAFEKTFIPCTLYSKFGINIFMLDTANCYTKVYFDRFGRSRRYV